MLKQLLFSFSLLIGLSTYSQIQIGNDIDGESPGSNAGNAVALSSDGNVLAIAAYRNDFNGNLSGHVRVYQNDGNAWTQIGDDIDSEAEGDQFGRDIALSADGNILAVGADWNDGNGNDAGHVRVFENNGGSWTQIGEDIDGVGIGDYFGTAVSLSSDGTILAASARWNNGNGSDAGHVRVFENNNGAWTQIGDDIEGEEAGDEFGTDISLSDDGTVLASGAQWNDGNGGNSGHVRMFKY